MDIQNTLEGKIERRRPEGKGLRFIRWEKIPTKGISADDEGNDARAAGIYDYDVQKFEGLIKSGGYLPEYYGYPTVMEVAGTYVLIDGYHRYKAHVKTGNDIWVAVVEFFDKDGQTAEHWRGVYKSRANDGSSQYQARLRTDDDISQTLVNLHPLDSLSGLTEVECTKLINGTMRELGVSPLKDRGKRIINNYYGKLGIHTKHVKTVSVDDLKEQFKNRDDVITVSFDALHDTKFDLVAIQKILTHVKDKEELPTVICSGKGNQKKIERIRTGKKSVITNLTDDIRNGVQMMQKNNLDINDLTFEWAPQIYGEEENVVVS